MDRKKGLFPPEAVLNACREMTKGDPSFKYLDSILSGVRSRGEARTEAQVKRQLDQENRDLSLAREVFSGLGALAPEVAIRLYRQYAQIYPHEVLMLAAEECRRKARSTVDDLQELLLSWQGKGLKTEEDVKSYLAAPRKAIGPCVVNGGAGKWTGRCPCTRLNRPGPPRAAKSLIWIKCWKRGTRRAFGIFPRPKARRAGKPRPNPRASGYRPRYTASGIIPGRTERRFGRPHRDPGKE